MMTTNLALAYSPVPAPVRRLRTVQGREQHLKALLLRGIAGDVRAETELLRAARQFLAAFYYRRLGYCAEAEDLVQEALLAVHQRSRAYDAGRPFMPWLFAIARHKLVDHFRRRKSASAIDDIERLSNGENFEDALIAKLDVAALLGTLPPKQAGAIRRTRLNELSVAEAAREAGLGESDVKVSAFRGLKALSARVARASLR